MAKAYRYKVIKSGKVCAEATTRAEAEREAARCGGTVRGPRQQNPALPIFVEERDGRGDVIISYPLTEDHTTAPTAASAMSRAQAILRDRVPTRSFSHVYEGRSKAAGQGYGWIVVIGPEYAAELAAPPPARSLAASFARRKRNPSRQFHAEVAAKDLAHARRLLEGLHRADVDLKPSARKNLVVNALVMAAQAYREFSHAGGSRKGYGPQVQEAGELYNQAEQALRGLVPNPRKVELTVPTAAEAGQFVGKYGAKAFRGLVTAGRGLASFVKSARAGAQAERGPTANPRKRGDPSTPRAFATLASARAFVSRHDLGGVFVVEGKGTAAKPYAVLDAGSAEDLLADDLGRVNAHRLLSDLDRAGRYVVRLSDYQTERGATANPRKRRNPSGLRTVRVTFADGDTMTTHIRGTDAEIRDYYVGRTFNRGHGGHDYLVEAVRVDFLT